MKHQLWGGRLKDTGVGRRLQRERSPPGFLGWGPTPAVNSCLSACRPRMSVSGNFKDTASLWLLFKADGRLLQACYPEGGRLSMIIVIYCVLSLVLRALQGLA